MGCAGMKEYSKEAWACGWTTVFRGRAVNCKRINININKKTSLFKTHQLRTCERKLVSAKQKFPLNWMKSDGRQLRWNLRSGWRTGSPEGIGRRPPATGQWMFDFLCLWNQPGTSLFRWQETLNGLGIQINQQNNKNWKQKKSFTKPVKDPLQGKWCFWHVLLAFFSLYIYI